ncbi:MAG: 3-isopropylmalate dehydratase large subunit [Deltaproteobacteria bacterium]|nr:3-isopropylmalate dehydratase large subunit [Deltaproteobacteria bacterium]
MGKTLYEKVFEKHTVKILDSGQHQVLVGLHMIHEVTSPQAFSMLKEKGLGVLMPERNFATSDHIIPTDDQSRPFKDELAEEMQVAIEKNVSDFGIKYFDLKQGNQGIVHVVAPEKGLTQPGMIICCGDSHTATHGAFGSIAMGIGTSQVRDVLATQTIPLSRLKVKRVEVNGKLKKGVTAKDVALYLIMKLGVDGGVGYAFEYGGEVFDNFTMEQRMTVCNMAIEGGARCGYVNPDETTYSYIKGREYAPKEDKWDEAVKYWESIKSDLDAVYDDKVVYDGADIDSMVTWGINPGQCISVKGTIPDGADLKGAKKEAFNEALEYMSFEAGQKILGEKIDVAFIGSCTNGRYSDFEEVAAYLKKSGLKVKEGVKALAVPGSQDVREKLIENGIDKILTDAGFEFRLAGCSMCLAMNPDKLKGRQMSVSSSNRNFKGRQGSSTGRTLLMSPIGVAASAIKGAVADPFDVFNI